MILLSFGFANAQNIDSSLTYLDSIKKELRLEWPKNHTGYANKKWSLS